MLYLKVLAGQVTILLNQSGSQFAGVVVATNGNLYVTEFNNNLISSVSISGGTRNNKRLHRCNNESSFGLSGVRTVLAGTSSSGFVDGSNANARFTSPQGITINSAGALFVADAGNNVIRQVTTNG